MTYGELQKRFDRWCSPVGYGGMLLAAVCFASFFIFYGEAAFVGKASTAGFGAWMLLAGALIGCLVGVGSLVYERHVEDRVLRPIREAWEKQFDDLFFLLSHSGLHPTHWETVRLLWTGPASSTPKTSSPVTMPLTDQLLFEAYASDRDSFDRRLLETIGAGVIDARDGKFFISQRVFEAARQAYPLDDFPVPEPPKLSALNIGLSE
ncbi:MAG: hypothetical protein AMXMBFR44_2180 [Candidatus Campbellbacteria bacterium]